MKPLIFAGTVEGRQLAEALSKRGIRPTVSVATPYGGSLLRGLDAEILCGRLDRPQMASLMRREGFTLVLDATHPYAAEVTATIRAACGETGLPYLRLRRE
ncbi:MAG: precorrin-6A/cobalt-precorrin-6A reductase, partial [Oscillospiraceae bacterium]